MTSDDDIASTVDCVEGNILKVESSDHVNEISNNQECDHKSDIPDSEQRDRKVASVVSEWRNEKWQMKSGSWVPSNAMMSITNITETLCASIPLQKDWKGVLFAVYYNSKGVMMHHR